jgi:hypothetical protein
MKYTLFFSTLIFWSQAFSQENLSSLGIVANTSPFELVSSFKGYDVNAPLWSGRMQKKRWIQVPEGRKLSISDEGEWSYPAGTILVKHFYTKDLNRETRVARNINGEWNFSSYKWKDDNSDALKIESEVQEEITIDGVSHSWTFPSEQTCLKCHSSNRVFGINTEQLNKEVNGVNQLRAFVGHNILEEFQDSEYLKKFISPMNESESIEKRARTYMHVNCNTCHSSLGSAPGGMDFNINLPIDLTNTYFVMASEGQVDGAGDFRILPGEKEQSVVWRRLKTSGHQKMSPLRPVKDEAAVNFIGKYIDELY